MDLNTKKHLIGGGEGNDIIVGGAGSDNYLYEIGDGFDTVIEENANSNDKNSIYITDTKSVRVREDGSDLVLDIGGDNPGNFGRITVENGAESDLIDKIEISSGSDTTHYGLLGDDTFERNTITNDTYMFRKGDGIDTIHDYLNGDKAVPRLENAGLDELVIEGYSKEQAVFNKDGNDLEVSFLDENNNIQQDRIVIKQYFNSDFFR